MLEANVTNSYDIVCPQFRQNNTRDAVPPCRIRVSVEQRTYQDVPGDKKFDLLADVIEEGVGIPQCPAMQYLREQQTATRLDYEPLSEMKARMAECTYNS